MALLSRYQEIRFFIAEMKDKRIRRTASGDESWSHDISHFTVSRSLGLIKYANATLSDISVF